MSIESQHFVWRICLNTDRDKKNKQIPAVRNFSLSQHDNFKLSVDWEKHTTPEECIARVGASYKTGTTEYKKHENREIYAMSVSDLNGIDEVQGVIHDPIYFEPCRKGQPNNVAHSLICIIPDFDEPELFVKIRDYAKNNRILNDTEQTQILINEYRVQCNEE